MWPKHKHTEFKPRMILTIVVAPDNPGNVTAVDILRIQGIGIPDEHTVSFFYFSGAKNKSPEN